MPKLSGISEYELIQKCKKGDLKYLEKLYKHFYGYAMGIGLRYLPDRDDVLEVVNDAFIKAFKNIGTYDEVFPFKAWLGKIVVNTALDRHRKNLRAVSVVDIEHAYTVSDSNLDVDQFAVDDILKLLNSLPEMHRTVFNMYEIDGYSHEEIANLLAIQPSSSRVYLTRAKEKLRSLLLKTESQL